MRYAPSHHTHYKNCKEKRATACRQLAASYRSLQGMQSAVQVQRLMVLPRSIPFVSPTTYIRSDPSISHKGVSGPWRGLPPEERNSQTRSVGKKGWN